MWRKFEPLKFQRVFMDQLPHILKGEMWYSPRFPKIFHPVLWKVQNQDTRFLKRYKDVLQEVKSTWEAVGGHRSRAMEPLVCHRIFVSYRVSQCPQWEAQLSHIALSCWKSILLNVSTAAKTFMARQGHSALCVRRVSVLNSLKTLQDCFSISKNKCEAFPF